MSQNRYAYLIGANGPAEMRLKYAEKDVSLLAEALKGTYCQFTCTEVVTAHSRADALKGFKSFTERCQPSDLLLIHFSGHAVFDEQLYLLCNDTDANDLLSTALEITTVKTLLRKSKSGYKVLILDCCHAAGAHSGGLKGEQDIRAMLHSTMQGSATIILSACSRKDRTRELDELDGGAGFLSWAICTACTTNFHEASSHPDLGILSLDDLWRNWLPKALEHVNKTLSVDPPLPPPILLSERACGPGNEVWLTPPPSPELDLHRTRDNEETRRKYLENVHKRYSSVTLPIGPAEGFSLQAIFQPLALRRDPLAAEDLERRQRRTFLGEQTQESDIAFDASSSRHRKDVHDGIERPEPPVIADNGEEALARSPQGRMIILGGPGTGKTTTLKYLVACRAKEALSDASAPTPIFLSLADLARSGKGLQSYLEVIAEEMGVERGYAERLWREIEHGHAFLALDSLDEVDPKQRARMIDLVNSRASESGNSWLVGSRFTEYKGGQFKHGQFAAWELLSMSTPLRQDLAARLFPELYRLLALPQESSSSPSTFVQLLENHAHAATWGENPLLFSLAAVVFVKTGGLPSSRATLYRDVIEAVLAMREQDTIGRNHLLRTLMALALWLHEHRYRTFTSADLLTFLEEIQQRSWLELEEITRRIIASGMLDIVARDTYGFRHQTFQEYLAAAELAKQLTSQHAQTKEDAWKLAWSKRTYSRWTEVLRLMVGVLVQLPDRKGCTVATRWLHQLMEQRSTEEGDPGDLGLALALKSFVEVAERAERSTMKLPDLEKAAVLLWLEQLFAAARNGRKTCIERLQALARDIVHLDDGVVDAAERALLERLRDKDADVRRVASEVLVTLGRRVPIERLLPLLHDKDEYVRQAVVKVLGAQGERVPIDRLLPLLHDKNEHMRSAAVEVLGAQGERVPIDHLLPLLHDKDVDVRQAVVKVLGAQGERVPIDHLLPLLHDKDVDVRRVTVKALGAQGERVPFDLLLRLLHDSEWRVRIATVEVLGAQGERVPIDHLLPLLHDKDVDVRRVTVKALGRQGEHAPIEQHLLPLLHDSEWRVREATVEVLGALGEHVHIEHLLPLLHDSHSHVQGTTVKALGAQGEHVPIERLLPLLHASASYMRQAAVTMLGEHAPIDHLLLLLHEEDVDVRQAAVKALHALGERVPIERLLPLLHDSASYMRQAAVTALGERIPIHLLLPLLHDPELLVQRTVVETLGALGERVPIHLLFPLLHDKDADVREAAVEVLGTLGEHVPIDHLLPLLHDSDGLVRGAAIYALGERIPIDHLFPLLHDEYVDVRQTAVEALGTLGEHVPIERLLPLLHDSHWIVRYAAVYALSAQGERVPIHLLLPFLHDSDGSVRGAAVYALSERVPIDHLLSLLHDARWIVRLAAVEALGTLGECVPIERLLPFLHDSEWPVRQTAVKALGERVPIDHLLPFLHDSDSDVRMAAVQALGALGERVPIDHLLPFLHDKDGIVRMAAVAVLKNQKERVPIDTLRLLTYHRNGGVRLAALKVLEAQITQIPVELLITLLSDEKKDVCRVALQLLKQVAPQVLSDLLPQATAALQGTPVGNVFGSLAQMHVADTLGELGITAPELLEALTALLNWPHWLVRIKAIEALGKLRRNIPDAAIKRLLELRRDPDPRMKAVREAADDALGETLSLEAGIEDE